jgi:hypothetical protein
VAAAALRFLYHRTLSRSRPDFDIPIAPLAEKALLYPAKIAACEGGQGGSREAGGVAAPRPKF